MSDYMGQLAQTGYQVLEFRSHVMVLVDHPK